MSRPACECHGLGDCPAARPPQPFHALPLATQAALKCRDVDFQAWLRGRDPAAWAALEAATCDGPEIIAAALVRRHCGVASRREIAAGTLPGDTWRTLLAAFEDHRLGRP